MSHLSKALKLLVNETPPTSLEADHESNLYNIVNLGHLEALEKILKPMRRLEDFPELAETQYFVTLIEAIVVRYMYHSADEVLIDIRRHLNDLPSKGTHALHPIALIGALRAVNWHDKTGKEWCGGNARCPAILANIFLDYAICEPVLVGADREGLNRWLHGQFSDAFAHYFNTRDLDENGRRMRAFCNSIKKMPCIGEGARWMCAIVAGRLSHDMGYRHSLAALSKEILAGTR